MICSVHRSARSGHVTQMKKSCNMWPFTTGFFHFPGIAQVPRLEPSPGWITFHGVATAGVYSSVDGLQWLLNVPTPIPTQRLLLKGRGSVVQCWNLLVDLGSK